MSHNAKERPIRFSFDQEKATATASLLLRLGGGQMKYLRLIKLMYYADREALDRLGRPITGDRCVAMPHGPVLSTVYDLVKATIFSKVSGVWAEHVAAIDRYTLALKGEPDLRPLSEAEVNIIGEVFERYGKQDRWSLRDATHDLPEWQDPGTTSQEIPVETILAVLGKSTEEIDEVREVAKEQTHFAAIFSR